MDYRPLKYKEFPIFPTDQEAIYYTEIYLDSGEPPLGWRKGYLHFKYSDTILLATTWGFQNVFFAVAYPPSGITIADVDDVLLVQLFEGWILDYTPEYELFNVRYKASLIGLDNWKQQRQLIKDNS